jgi:hypothetical protein
MIRRWSGVTCWANAPQRPSGGTLRDMAMLHGSYCDQQQAMSTHLFWLFNPPQRPPGTVGMPSAARAQRGLRLLRSAATDAACLPSHLHRPTDETLLPCS